MVSTAEGEHHDRRTESLHKVACRLSKFAGIPVEELEPPLRAFFTEVADSGKIDAVAMMGRNEGYARPFLDMYLLWNSPIDRQDVRYREQWERLMDMHNRFALEVEGKLEPLVHFVDPRRHTKDSIKQQLQRRRNENRNCTLIVVTRLQQPARVG